MRAGAEYLLEPSVPARRRYEALRAYLVEGLPASVVERFAYPTATLHPWPPSCVPGRSLFFVSSKPGPKGPRKAHTVRYRVLKLRAGDASVTDIAKRLAAPGDAGLGPDGVADPSRPRHRAARGAASGRTRAAYRGSHGRVAARVAGGEHLCV